MKAGALVSMLPPKKLRSDCGLSNRPLNFGKSMAAVKSLMSSSFQGLHHIYLFI